MKRVLPLLLLSACIALQAGQISGTVVVAQSGEPLASVDLTLSPVQRPEQGRQDRRGRGYGPSFGQGPTARTALDGRFVFSDVEPGDYLVGASKAGYEGGGRVARRVTLDEGDSSVSMQIEINRSPAIEGRVVDADGDPIAGARLDLRAWTMAEGRRVLRMYRSAETDDLGEYRMYNLGPGQYLVYLHPMRLGMMQGGVLHETTGAYYPQGANPNEGTYLKLSWSGEVEGIDFVAPPAGKTLVSGTVLGEDGLPCGECSIAIVDESGLPVAVTRVSDAGRFAVQGLAHKDYTFTANAPRGSGTAVHHAFLPDDRPVEMSLRLAPGQPISGALVAGETEDGEPVSFDRATLRLLPADTAVAGRPLGSRVTPDGAFQIAIAPQGDYSVLAYGLPANGYLRRVRLGASELPGGLLHVGEGAITGLTLDIAFDGGSLQGRPLAEDGKSPAPPDGMVVLVPLDRDAPPSRQQVTGYQGVEATFRFQGVAPGDYLVFAAPRNFAWDWSDPALLGELRRRAARVEVKARETAEVDAPYLEGP